MVTGRRLSSRVQVSSLSILRGRPMANKLGLNIQSKTPSCRVQALRILAICVGFKRGWLSHMISNITYLSHAEQTCQQQQLYVMIHVEFSNPNHISRTLPFSILPRRINYSYKTLSFPLPFVIPESNAGSSCNSNKPFKLFLLNIVP